MSNPLAIHEAFKSGDLEMLKAALGDPPDFPNGQGPHSIGIILEYAIYHSPFPFIRTLLELGADPNYYQEHVGFPSLIATLSCSDRPDMYEIVELLLSSGADIQQRGINDYTPLHYAAARNDVKGIELLLSYGADSMARTTIDEYATPLEEAEILGQSQAVEILRNAEREKS